MPRRELWLLNALLAPSAQAVPVWVSVSPESPLATAGAVLGDGLSPVETITIRTRYRTDVTGNSGFNDPSGRVWLVNEVLRQGRRWLDVGLSRYALRSYPRTLAPPDAVRLVPTQSDPLGGYDLFGPEVADVDTVWLPGGSQMPGVVVVRYTLIDRFVHCLTVGTSDPSYQYAHPIPAARGSTTQRALSGFGLGIYFGSHEAEEESALPELHAD